MVRVKVMTIENVDPALQRKNQSGLTRVRDRVDIGLRLGHKAQHVWFFVVRPLEEDFVMQSRQWRLFVEAVERIENVERTASRNDPVGQG